MIGYVLFALGLGIWSVAWLVLLDGCAVQVVCCYDCVWVLLRLAIRVGAIVVVCGVAVGLWYISVNVLGWGCVLCLLVGSLIAVGICWLEFCCLVCLTCSVFWFDYCGWLLVFVLGMYACLCLEFASCGYCWYCVLGICFLVLRGAA